MASQLFLLPFRPALDANALPVTGARLFFYASGTSTPQPVYSDEALTVALSSPVTADAVGAWPSIYLDQTLTYRVVVKDADGNTLPNGEADPYIPGVVDALAPEVAANAAAAAAQAGLAENYATILSNYSLGIRYATAADGVDPVVGVAVGRSYEVLTAGRIYGYMNDGGVATGPTYELPTVASVTGGDNTWSGDNTLTGKLDQTITSGLTGGTFSPFINANIQESYTTGTSFFLPYALVAEKLTGATGNRTALYVTQGSAVNEPGKFIVGFQGTAIARSGSSGSFYGINGYGEVLAGALTTAECGGGEANTSVRNASVLRKVGWQIADVDGSTGAGTDFDAGLNIIKSTDSIGYNNGILFSSNNTPGNLAVKTTGTVLKVDGGTVANGIDLTDVTFTGDAFKSNGFAVDKDGKTTVLGVKCRAGQAGAVQSNIFNVEWDSGTSSAILWVDGTRLGKITVVP